MMNYQQLFVDTEEYVVNMFDQHRIEHLCYHNLSHTKYVVKRATEIAAHYELSEEDTFIILLSAWFHDVGYLFGDSAGHEERSVDKMKEYAAAKNLSEEVVERASTCILATSMQARPQNLLEEILKDADSYNLGTKRFKKSNRNVCEEGRAAGNEIEDADFYKKTIAMMEGHKFYTSYAQEALTDSKSKNMKKLQSKLNKLEVEKEGKKEVDDNLVINEKQGTTKGMQTMLRLTSTNHLNLSEMADSKANILISVNAIIISVILSVLLRKLGEDPYLTIPTLIFLTSSVVTIVLAIIATRPQVNTGVFKEEDVAAKKTNLLFFGNFHKMEFQAYSDAMKTMMKDADYLYSSMVQDIYVLGTVLGRKYKLLRIAYTLFMIGIIVSVLAFAVASIVSGSAPIEMRGPSGNTTGSPF